MGQKPSVNRLYGTKGVTALLLALAMLVVGTAGAATAEQAQSVEALENEMVKWDSAEELEADLILTDALLVDRELDENFSIDDVQPIDNESQIVIFVWTNGEDALVVVVLFDDDGREILKIARMSVEEARARLANFDGRIVVRHVAPPGPEPTCGYGYLAARWSVDLSTDANTTAVGQFKGVWMNAESVVGGNINGQFANGSFRGLATNLDGEVIGTLQGGYGNGYYRGVWELSDGSASGVLAGQYRATDAGQGIMKGKWKQTCDDGGVEPTPVDPKPIRCKIMTTDAANFEESADLDDARCKVKPQPIDDVKPMKKPTLVEQTQIEDKDGFDDVLQSAEDLLETELVEIEGGVTLDLGDAATGGAVSAIPMLGIGLIRRRFLL